MAVVMQWFDVVVTICLSKPDRRLKKRYVKCDRHALLNAGTTELGKTTLFFFHSRNVDYFYYWLRALSEP